VGEAPPLRTGNAVPAAAITTSAMAISVHISSRDAGVHKSRRDGLAALALLPVALPVSPPEAAVAHTFESGSPCRARRFCRSEAPGERGSRKFRETLRPSTLSPKRLQRGAFWPIATDDLPTGLGNGPLGRPHGWDPASARPSCAEVQRRGPHSRETLPQMPRLSPTFIVLGGTFWLLVGWPFKYLGPLGESRSEAARRPSGPGDLAGPPSPCRVRSLYP
jgi:hypothetical protein